MERPAVRRAILGGFVATALTTALSYVRVGSFSSASAPLHFVIGSLLFPLIFAFLIYPVLGGSPWVRGAVWGVILWFLAQAVVVPATGMGFFSARTMQPAQSILWSLMKHVAYGCVLGAIAGPALARRLAVHVWEQPPKEKAA